VFAQLAALVRVPLSVALIVAVVISLVLRQRRASGQEHQQLKWFTTSIVVVTMIGVAWAALAAPYGWQSAMPAWAEGLGVASGLSVVLIPVSAGIAILKYHLYDIDVVINRTLVYGLLTALLALIYFGGVTATEAIFHALTGQEEQPQLAIVVSTLVIAALFNPLRRRIQSFIDRRFYRSKYDAAKTLEVFSAQLRDETDLDALSEDLVGVVRETMQPAYVSLWLRLDLPSRRSETAE
jgi:multisubunit Na+/H+ antiporter MnhB subunit